ncbi:hypothetical protein N7486_004303 [Penicillium sp. IBT 16267x]|nr:hypothetical protein N7486_004303 [Penicillium sp. IBT 16267x]
MARRPSGGGQFRQARKHYETSRIPPSRRDQRLTPRRPNQSQDASTASQRHKWGSEWGEALLGGNGDFREAGDRSGGVRARELRRGEGAYGRGKGGRGGRATHRPDYIADEGQRGRRGAAVPVAA